MGVSGVGAGVGLEGTCQLEKISLRLEVTLF